MHEHERERKKKKSEKRLNANALGEFAGLGFLQLCLGSIRLLAKNMATPVLAIILPLLSEVGIDSLDQLVERTKISLLDISETHSSSFLLVNQSTKTCFPFDNTIGNAHFAAQGRKPHDNLNRVNIMCNDYKFRLFLFDKCCHVVDSIFDHGWFLGLGHGLSFGFCSCNSQEPFFLLRLAFRTVISGKLKKFRSCTQELGKSD